MDSPCLSCRFSPLDVFPNHALEPAGIRLDDRGVNGESFTTYKPRSHAAPNNGLEHVTEEIALAETSMAVLAERRVVGNLVLQAEPAEPT